MDEMEKFIQLECTVDAKGIETIYGLTQRGRIFTRVTGSGRQWSLTPNPPFEEFRP